MASSANDSRNILEGVFAVNKPIHATSAGVLDGLKKFFNQSPLFAPWLEANRRQMYLNHSKAHHINRLEVKLGHGGTLDPLATGVLVVGIGRGTKVMKKFLEGSKTYECVVLFGAATDSYDIMGNVIGKADHAHVTRKFVEEKLEQFRGEIMQKPSIFSALKVDGKKMYEYARERKDIPEMKPRKVTVKKLELVEWHEPGAHNYEWPTKELGEEDTKAMRKVLGIDTMDADFGARHAASRGEKRVRSPTPKDHVESAGEQPKRARADDEAAMSGALPVQNGSVDGASTDILMQDTTTEPNPTTTLDVDANLSKETNGSSTNNSSQPPVYTGIAPAAVLRMTVGSGFYVRSLCHDLGVACKSLAVMSSLVRTRQGIYTLGNDNVLELNDTDWPPLSEEEKARKVWSAKKPTNLATPTTATGAADIEMADESTPAFKPWEIKLKAVLEEYMRQEDEIPMKLGDDAMWNDQVDEEEKNRRERGMPKGQRHKGDWKKKGPREQEKVRGYKKARDARRRGSNADSDSD